tara:strand:- start:919 stop:1512 length:594 start_codon:yes stop_codon:yes gene_type:complete
MSATSAPFGFRPSYHNSGRITAKAYVIASGYAQNIFQGDPVKLTDAGVITLATSDGTRSGTTDGIKMLGILAGTQYIGSTGRPELSPFWPASTAGTEIIAWVYDDPATIYDVMYTNPSSGTTVQTAVGEQCDWTVASPGGSTQVGLSTTSLTAIQSTSAQFQITGIAGGVDNALTDAYVTVTVRINESQYQASVNSV